MSIIIPKGWYKGLGTQIVALCAINSSKYNTVKFLEKTEEYYNFLYFVEYYNLNINIEYTRSVVDEDIEITFDDLSKIYAPYFKKDIDLTGNKHICLVMYQDSTQISYDKNKKEFPYNKIYTIDQYSKIFKFIKQAGYDVMTIDSRELSLSKKISMLSKCTAAIGYEGGIAHLCHTIGLPYIMLPWKHRNTVKFNQMELLHLDKKTYFLKSYKELLTYDPKHLLEIVNTLHHNCGNNSLLKNNKLLDDFKSVIPLTESEQLLFPKRKILGG